MKVFILIAIVFAFGTFVGHFIDKSIEKNTRSPDLAQEYTKPESKDKMITAHAIAKNGGYVSKLYINRFEDGPNVCYIYGESISCLKK